MVYFSLLTASVLLTFSQYSFSQLIGMLNLPAYELEFL
jgi:hypothetical protein